MSQSVQPNGPLDEDLLRLAIKPEVDVSRSTVPGMEIRLKEVVAIIRPQRWSHTKLLVQRLGVQAFTHIRVLGRGRERGLQYLPRKGAAHGMGVRYLPKRMISWIVEEAQVEPLLEAILEANRTGQLGDGKIFVLPVDNAVRVRTNERGVEALRAEASFERVSGTMHGFPTTQEMAALPAGQPVAASSL